MKRSATRWLRAFPRSWRVRYGEELTALVRDLDDDGDLRAADRLDLWRSGLRMRRAARTRRAALGLLSAVVALVCVLGGLTLSGELSLSPKPPASRARAVAPVTHEALLLPEYKLLCRRLSCPTSAPPKLTIVPSTPATTGSTKG